jgi:transcriptional regulator with XRE-family HTH domain
VQRWKSYSAIVGGVIVELRGARGVTQAAVAEAVGVHSSVWSRAERGQSAITVEQLRRAAGVLGRSPSAILAVADDQVRGDTRRGRA